MKIFHVVENLDKGAVENWLVNIFLESRKYKPEWEWTFYCILGKEGRLDQRVRAAGGRVIYSPYLISEKVKFLRNMRRSIRQEDYDVLHVHHDYLSGFYLLSTIGVRFKKKILHIHNTDRAVPVGSLHMQKFLLRPLRYLAIRLSNIVVGISKDTLSEFLQEKKLKRKKSEVLYYGIDLKKFKSAHRESGWLRKEMGVPSDSKILLFAGRMNELKNPLFVVEILRILLMTHKDTYALFVGKGGEEATIIERSLSYGLKKNVRLAGWRDDLADIMKEADVFIFPRIEHPREGLGLVVVEAQSAGLPMVLSHGIVEDAIVIPELAHFIFLQNGPKEWASQIERIFDNERPITSVEALERMQKSPFELSNATKHLIALYEN